MVIWASRHLTLSTTPITLKTCIRGFVGFGFPVLFFPPLATGNGYSISLCWLAFHFVICILILSPPSKFCIMSIVLFSCIVSVWPVCANIYVSDKFWLRYCQCCEDSISITIVRQSWFCFCCCYFCYYGLFFSRQSLTM